MRQAWFLSVARRGFWAVSSRLTVHVPLLPQTASGVRKDVPTGYQSPQPWRQDRLTIWRPDGQPDRCSHRISSFQRIQNRSIVFNALSRSFSSPFYRLAKFLRSFFPHFIFMSLIAWVWLSSFNIIGDWQSECYGLLYLRTFKEFSEMLSLKFYWKPVIFPWKRSIFTGV